MFFEVKSDGFTLSTQRRPINGAFQGDEPNIYDPPCGDLPKAVKVFKEWQKALETGNLEDFKEKYVDNEQVWIADIDEIKEKDFNLNPGLYRKVERGKVKWEWVRLGEVANIEWGNTSITKKSYVERGYPAYSASGQDGFLPFFERESEAIILSAIGARSGKCFWATNKWTAIKNTIIITSKDTNKLDLKFLFYIVNDENFWKKRGGGQSFISLTTAKNETIPLPPLEVQKKIVERLDKQQTIIEKAKEMEKAIIDAGIDDAIFQGDWEWVELGEVAEINPENRNPQNKPNDEFIYIDIASVDGNTGKIIDFKKLKGQNAPSRARRVIRINDVIVSTVRPYLRAFAIIEDKIFNEQICSTGFAVLRSNNEILPKYLFSFVRSNLFLKQIIGNMQGSNYPAITQDDIKTIKIPLPPLEKQKEIVEFLDVQFQALEKIRYLKENAEKTIKLILEKEVFGDE